MALLLMLAMDFGLPCGGMAHWLKFFQRNARSFGEMP